MLSNKWHEQHGEENILRKKCRGKIMAGKKEEEKENKGKKSKKKSERKKNLILFVLICIY